MKLFKMNFLWALIAVLGLSFTACEEDSTTTEPTVTPTAVAPTNLRAAAKSETSILLRWDNAVSQDSTWYKGFEITATPSNGGAAITKTIAKTVAQPYEFTGLTNGVKYAFVIKGVNTANVVSSSSAQLMWAPSMVWTDPYKMYIFTSSNGSGLSLYDATNKKPMNLKAAEKTKWHLGFDDRDSKLVFGSASLISIGSGTPADICEIGSVYFEGSSLDQVFSNESLVDMKDGTTTITYSPNSFDLKTLNATNNLIFLVRIKTAGTTNWNYAKVMIEKGANGFLQTDHIVVYVSYQTAVDVPYAKTAVK